MSTAGKTVRKFLTADLLKRPLDNLAFDDPIEAAQAAGELSGLGVEAEIRAYVLVTRTRELLKDDKVARVKFAERLVEEKFISQKEADLRNRSPKLSNIAKIASMAHVLLSPELKPYVPSGYQPQYELAKLYEELKAATPEERLQQLLSICKKADGKLTIAFMKSERVALKEPEGDPSAASSANHNQTELTAPQDAQAFNLILWTPSEADYDNATNDDSAESPRCMALNAAEQAIGILVCPAILPVWHTSTCRRPLIENS